MLSSDEIRKRFLDFYKNRDHEIIPSSSLVPENDPSSLFINSGMQPLVPYLLGQPHPLGTKIANFQKVVRTIDIDEVGDNTHLTLFEMMGNWSLGDYFKKETIEWSFELLTSKEEGFGLDLNRVYITCFEGNEDAPKDTESAEIWKSLGIPEHRIYFRSAEDNWWSPGDNGPCGPDSEMFYDVTEKGLGDLTPEEFEKADENQDVVEIGNNVFIQYKKENGKVVGTLEQRNVDVGWGFERVVIVSQGKSNVFQTDLFQPILDKIKELSKEYNDREGQIIADHMRAAVFMISDGVLPSNTDQGYVLRRIIRRSIKYADSMGIDESNLQEVTSLIIEKYGSAYSNISEKSKEIISVINDEEVKFRKTLKSGMKQLEKMISSNSLNGEKAFILFSTYGFPFELTKEIATEKGIKINDEEFEKEFKKHQEKSRTASEGKFKGGLASTGEQEVKFHTATHLLHAALRDVLGEHVLQKGSNITPERLRFDFSHGEKMTDEQKRAVEDWVNDKVSKDLPVTRSEMTYDEAQKLGAIGLFEDKYGEKVSVYTVGDESSEICSRELCGGPHVSKTSELGKFKIKKEEASSAGVRRIKAVLE